MAACTRKEEGGASAWLPGLRNLCFWLCVTAVIGEAASGGGGGDRRPPVSLLINRQHVVLDNGIVRLTLSNPDGLITGIRYQGVDNLMETRNRESNRGYWDVIWVAPDGSGLKFDLLRGTEFSVVVQNEDQVEVSFRRRRDNCSPIGEGAPANVDRRFVLLRGSSGFYSYGIFEHFEEWPRFHVAETRITMKLSGERFHYMAVSDDRQRTMPMAEDRDPPRGRQLGFKEAVLLLDPINPTLKGEVDCKYQYSAENKDIKVHGWISSDPAIGFWQITPSGEFRTGGPLKQSLTSHVGPTTLAVFISDHYAGRDLVLDVQKGEYWKKVFGPVFFYLNTSPIHNSTSSLWEDAKSQDLSSVPMRGGHGPLFFYLNSRSSLIGTGWRSTGMLEQVMQWPYSFPASKDFLKAHQRGSVSGRLLVRDRYTRAEDMPAASAYVGLALPGEAGSWQRESKGYQFWVEAAKDGSFKIGKVLPGTYNLYAWVPGFVGDWKHAGDVIVSEGSHDELGDLVFEPPRTGPTLWEIGVPDRSAAEFYIPDPNPMYINKLFLHNAANRFRQYGLWERYAELHPRSDLVYEIGASNYSTDWFFEQVPRRLNDSNFYEATTWQIWFRLDRPAQRGCYTLRIALAAARAVDLEVRINAPAASPPHFSTGLIGDENSVARMGIHGLYRLYSIAVPGWRLVAGRNVIYLKQSRHLSPFQGLMYDYLRLEAPEIPKLEVKKGL